MTDDAQPRVIDRWFPCAVVDEACQKPTGSGRNEKAVFVWFASRPIAQARAAVAAALLKDSPEARTHIEAAVRGDDTSLQAISRLIREQYPENRPTVLDPFSGRGIIPLEAARFGANVVGIDLSPVATLAGRVLADYPMRDWSGETPLLARPADGLWDNASRARFAVEAEEFVARVGEKVRNLAAPYYPANPDGSYPWGYLWALAMPCDGCGRYFPLVGSMTLRHPYRKTGDPGQALRIVRDGGRWRAEVKDGLPDQQPTVFAGERLDGSRRKGKSAKCVFCGHIHSLDTVKAKGIAGHYHDEPLVAADTIGAVQKVFRPLREEERTAALDIDLALLVGGEMSAIPDELIPANNVHSIQASGYGYATFGSMMNARQAAQFALTVRAVREAHAEVRASGASEDYARALASIAAATLVRRLKMATRGARLLTHGRPDGSQQNRVQVDHVFANESKLAFQLDWFETGLGKGPGTWESVAETGLKPYGKHIASFRGRPARFRSGDAMALPFRDGTVDAVVTDPPYDDMIEYADASDLMFVWLRRALYDIEPDLFGTHAPTQDRLQPKDSEIIVRRVQDPARTIHDGAFYESSLSQAFREARRVLRADGRLVVVFGHSDPEAWRKLLAALHEAGYLVTSSWPSRTESANTGVASIRVTVTIGCRVAPPDSPIATAAEVDRQAAELVRSRVPGWTRDGLALGDQMMAAYGPVMEVYGHYSQVIEPDGSVASIDRYLTIARRAVREATALRLETLPLETFDALTRFAVMWMKLHGRTLVPKGEARFLAQADSLRIEEIRGHLVAESSTGFRLVLDPPKALGSESALFDVARAMVGGYIASGSDGAATALARSERPPDDEHLWALIGWLGNELPPSDPVAKAVSAIIRNGSTIRNASKGIAVTRNDGTVSSQATLFAPWELSR